MGEHSRLRGVALVVGGVALGVGIAVGVPLLVATSSDDAPTALGRSADGDPSSLLDPTRLAEVDGDRARTGSAREAVEQFLSATQDGDRASSFALLADPLRLDYGSVSAWAADPDAVPPVVGFEVEASPADEGGPFTVTTLTRYQSSLDSVAGLVPGRARTSWAVVQEQGGWAVDLDATTQEPLLPPDADAVSATRDWAGQAQRCETDPLSVRGQSSLAAELCEADGAIEVGQAAPLSPLDAGALQTSLGGEVGGWARAVDVNAPVALRAVLAPVDDLWQVVAVLPPPGRG